MLANLGRMSDDMTWHEWKTEVWMSGINHGLVNREATLIRTGTTGFQVRMKMAGVNSRVRISAVKWAHGNSEEPSWAVCRNMTNTSMNFSCAASRLLTVWAWHGGLWCCFRGNPLEECREKNVLKTGGDNERVVTNKGAVSVYLPQVLSS